MRNPASLKRQLHAVLAFGGVTLFVSGCVVDKIGRADALGQGFLDRCARAPLPPPIGEPRKEVLRAPDDYEMTISVEVYEKGRRCVVEAKETDSAVMMKHLVRALGPTDFHMAEQYTEAASMGGSGPLETLMPLDDSGSYLRMIRGTAWNDDQERVPWFKVELVYKGPSDVAPVDYFASRRATPGFEEALAARFAFQLKSMADQQRSVDKDRGQFQEEDARRREVARAQAEADRQASQAQTDRDMAALMGKISGAQPGVEAAGTGAGPGLTVDANAIPTQQTGSSPACTATCDAITLQPATGVGGGIPGRCNEYKSACLQTFCERKPEIVRDWQACMSKPPEPTKPNTCPPGQSCAVAH